MGIVRVRKSCIACGTSPYANHYFTEPVIKLPPTPPANAFVPESKKEEEQPHYPLDLQFCGACGHLQLAHVVSPHELFHNYVYKSGTSRSFRKHFEEYAETVVERLGLTEQSKVVEIGSNDSTLAQLLAEKGIAVWGIDPSASAEKTSKPSKVYIERSYFSRHLAFDLAWKSGPFDAVIANNVFAHVDDLVSFAKGVRDLLHPDGEFIFEVSYLGDVVEKRLFDTIYHEHLSYHSMMPLLTILSHAGLHLYDVERIPTHGGSIRCYASRANKLLTKRLRALMDEEVEKRLHLRETFVAFAGKIQSYKECFAAAFESIGASYPGKVIAGFGAPAKLTTLLYTLMEEKPFDISYIADDAEKKQGLFTPGMHIPVVPPSKMREKKPDIVVVFAWNFWKDIIQRSDELAPEAIWFNPVTAETKGPRR